MFSMPYLCICIYCMLQLSFFIIMDRRYRNTSFTKECYFPLILVMMLLSFVADIVSTLNQTSDWFFPFAAAGNYFEIIINTMLLPVFYLYVCAQIYNMDKILKQRIYNILWILAVICSMVVISTAFTGQIFYFDDDRMYHRGHLFWLPMMILLVMMLIIQVFIIKHKPKIEVRHYKSLIFFLLLPLLGWGLQFLIFGLPFSLICGTLAAQIVFINIQNLKMSIDYLTGVFNRKELDKYMQNKIAAAVSNQSFSAILLDIDNFKSINDQFGHYEGDLALSDAVNILRNSFENNEFIARYGGDEFCIILDSDQDSELEITIQRINSNLLNFNKHSQKPYELSFSMGYAVYHPSIGKSSELFLNTIDQKMYVEKKSRKK
ncbi:GGDEF domain-containing protein [Aminipila terrae]|uniref:Diguanylate cyclase n=1 Tax=Aminipila terrae TaxID=2697030 RepID=A0A6P1MFZ3_9FIRM|nr:GGDEF domain-containing protein [Aminipila terrae]QHI73620.1 diguanylate cyclase [Aminipila terrae]